MHKGLTPKQKQFVERYLIHLNASQAYKEAYKPKNSKSAESCSIRLLRNVKIQDAIQAGTRAKSTRNEIDQDWVISRLKAVADGHIGKVCSFEGSKFSLKLSEDLSDDDKRCLSSIKKKETQTQFGGSSEFEVRLREPVRALELLGRHIGMWTDGQGDDPGDPKTHKAAILAATRRIRKTG